MPNWAEGSLKVRGKEKDIVAFLRGALGGIPSFGASIKAALGGGEIEVPGVTIEEDDFNMVISSPNGLHIEGSRRAFIEGSVDYWFLDEDDEEEPAQVVFTIDNFKQAWAVQSDNFARLSEKYNIDIKIHAFERGMQFNQLIEIHKGEIIHDQEIQFDDYEWECVMPNLGG
ncbi:hypothetical protein [Planococcus sp. SSTMD024]|uniref:hypothetical protein n=1 Tax=Planococcus sp. SSTMD024 TaxID=3242163 RepID=UPI00351ED776